MRTSSFSRYGKPPTQISDLVHPYWGQYYALSYLGLARGYVLAGDGTQARYAYEQFFALWKTADPDLRSGSPVLGTVLRAVISGSSTRLRTCGRRYSG